MADLTRLTAWAILLAAATTSLADPGDAPKESPKGAWMLEGDKASQKIQHEIEKVRQELGAGYSLESKELGISFERSEAKPQPGQEGAASSQPGNTLPQDKAELEVQLQSISQKTQDQARKLEELAADAETRMDYQLADRLREIAKQQWQAARAIRMPISGTETSCKNCSGNQFELHSLSPVSPLSTPIPPGVNGPGPGVITPLPFFPWNMQAPSTRYPEATAN
ncbi:hypothetical protein [Blastopirellula marina]|uniref:Uncharacterized protein n=1 Tax=Blastopirellula marina TaxID=124 RepID=A0A2S8G133_9BACT|nr:hypothetical protein [Blastopirellula marina]PQO38157.1 hypothetical protein C5Y98_08770 [Blastopirellula marina]PTL44813.1 hypothetical protein C5Y97_08775 [Blastopirellula marina]